MEKDNHIQVDLDFLDKDKEALSQSPDQPKTQVKRETEYNWKKIIITIICVVFFIGLLASDDGSSTSTSSPPTSYSNTNSNSYNSGNELVATGEFMCTSYHNRKATELEPTNEYQIELERSRLDRKATELESLESRISYSTVTEYSSQWEIDQYNQMIDNYNSGLAQYERDFDRLQSSIDSFNARVETYNNYLITNCDPR